LVNASAQSLPRGSAPARLVVRVFYFDDQDLLLCRAVRPLIEHVRPAVAAAYFVRHWRQGPHVRVHIQLTPESSLSEIERSVDNTIAIYLREVPSCHRDREENLLDLHERLAELEEERGPLRPWARDNSIRISEEENREHVLNDDLREILVQFYEQTNDLVFDTIEDTLGDRPRRLAMSFDLMVATAHVLGGNIAASYLSYRSHADAYIAGCDDPGTTRSLLDSRYESRAASFVSRVSRLLESLESGRPPAQVEAWLACLLPMWERAGAKIRTGDLRSDHPPTHQDLAAQFRSIGSPFHMLMSSNEEYMKRLATSKEFEQYRLALSWLYLHFNRIGLRPIDRLTLCHIAARSVEQLFRVSASDVMSKTTDSNSQDVHR
jgi:hypothetical protein